MPITYLYRGLSFLGKIASARDVGNYSAGFIAGRKGISWAEARLIMNLLESYQKMGFVAEGMTTQSAQSLGHQSGIAHFRQRTFMYNK